MGFVVGKSSYWFLRLFELSETCSRQLIGGGETGREEASKGRQKRGQKLYIYPK